MRLNGYLQSALGALRRLTGNDSGLFSSEGCMSWNDRFMHGHEVNLHGLHPDQIRFFLSITAWAFLRWMSTHSRGDRELRYLNFIDDARMIFRTRQLNSADPLLHHLDTGHAYGSGVVMATQGLETIDRAFLQSAGLIVLIGGQSPDDVMSIRTRMQLTSEQIEYCINQQPYHAVLHVRGAGLPPIPIKLLDPLTFTPKNIGDLSEHNTRLMLEGYEPKLWEPPAKDNHDEKASTVSKPTAKDTQSIKVPATFVAAIATLLKSPWMLQSEWKKAAGINTKDISQMETRGLIIKHNLGRSVFYEITEKAASLSKLGLPRLPGVGGYKHRWLVARVKAYHEKQGSKGRTEVAQGTQRIDAVVEHPGGTRVAYEVMLSDSNLSETINGLLAFDGARIIITDSKSATKAAKDAGIIVRSVSQAIRLYTN
jgi:hypothetical protein